jgi:hypothetical protein
MNKIKMILQDDPGFYITDGIALSGRAGFILTPDCPPEYVTMINHAWREGWIKSVAHVLESEYVWEMLSK